MTKGILDGRSNNSWLGLSKAGFDFQHGLGSVPGYWLAKQLSLRNGRSVYLCAASQRQDLSVEGRFWAAVLWRAPVFLHCSGPQARRLPCRPFSVSLKSFCILALESSWPLWDAAFLSQLRGLSYLCSSVWEDELAYHVKTCSFLQVQERSQVDCLGLSDAACCLTWSSTPAPELTCCSCISKSFELQLMPLPST